MVVVRADKRKHVKEYLDFVVYIPVGWQREVLLLS